MSDLSKRLRELRQPRLTQRDVAVLIGCSAALVSSWESGTAIPPLVRISQYVDLFGDEHTGLATELLDLRERAGGRSPEYLAPVSTTELLQDIRWLLRQILDRLPPGTSESEGPR